MKITQKPDTEFPKPEVAINSSIQKTLFFLVPSILSQFKSDAKITVVNIVKALKLLMLISSLMY